MYENDRVTQHALAVVNGEVVSGRLHRLACQRHLKDLERQNTDAFPYYYEEAAAAEVLNYAETLTVSEGYEKTPVKLIPEQAFDIGCTFGWKKCSNHKRRFRRRYKSVARQNGKTFENGIMGTYVAGFGGYYEGKLFTVATKHRQAKLAWDEMRKFIKVDPDLEEYFQVKEYISTIRATETNCTIEALSKESGLDDGFRSIFSSIDEIHQHRDNKIYKALYNGTRALPETLVSMITTRGDKLNSFCKEMDDYCIKILEGVATSEDFFVDIYAIDKDDDPFDEAVWIKANPFLFTNHESVEVLRQDAATAKEMGGSDLRDFLTKCLNIWVNNTDDQFINVNKWKKGATRKTLEDFRGQPCTIGIDCSSGGDLTTYSLEFEEGKGVYFYSHSFMPRGRLEEHIETDLAPYDLWVENELITVTGSAMDFKNDYKFMINDLKNIVNEYDLKPVGIGIDPHNADGILGDLEEFGCPVIMVTQSCKSLNDATVDIQLLVKSELVSYNEGNELLTWSFTNACVVRNSFDEIKVDKKARERFKRIDPVDACIDAHFVKLKNTPEEIDTGDALNKYLSAMGWN
jgi:phage terminase large subunit-like protein